MWHGTSNGAQGSCVVRYVMVNVVKLLRGARHVHCTVCTGQRSAGQLCIMVFKTSCVVRGTFCMGPGNGATRGALCYGYCGEIVVVRDSMVAGNGAS